MAGNFTAHTAEMRAQAENAARLGHGGVADSPRQGLDEWLASLSGLFRAAGELDREVITGA